MKKKCLKRNIILAVCLATVMTIGGIAAYFTDTDSATNVFTVGKVEVQLTEPQYDAHPDDHKNLTPGKLLDKDPQITNTGINDAYVFLDVTIPKANAATAESDGSRNPALVQELFSYEISDGWTQIVKEDRADGCRYVYVYGDSKKCTPLAAGQTTPSLFKDGKIRFINVIEGQGFEEEMLELPVDAYGIQTTDIQGGTSNPQEVWSVLDTQNVDEIL